MGRINLAALRVRSRNVRASQAGATPYKAPVSPAWGAIMADIPPAQILTRQQPTQHAYTETRTKTLPRGPSQITSTITHPKPKSAKPRNLYSPHPLRYEEDALRKRFFSDHPWELARPRTLVETTGDQHAHADWSTGLRQPGIPLSGESVVQRQLWLLHNVPDITVPEAYDVARREFYALRRRQQVATRVAIEEAEMFGADFGLPAMSVGMSKEDAMYEDWAGWAAEETIRMSAQRAGFEGQQVASEQKSVEGGDPPSRPLGSRFGGSREGFAERAMGAPSERVGSSLV